MDDADLEEVVVMNLRKWPIKLTTTGRSEKPGLHN